MLVNFLKVILLAHFWVFLGQIDGQMTDVKNRKIDQKTSLLQEVFAIFLRKLSIFSKCSIFVKKMAKTSCSKLVFGHFSRGKLRFFARFGRAKFLARNVATAPDVLTRRSQSA